MSFCLNALQWSLRSKSSVWEYRETSMLVPTWTSFAQQWAAKLPGWICIEAIPYSNLPFRTRTEVDYPDFQILSSQISWTLSTTCWVTSQILLPLFARQNRYGFYCSMIIILTSSFWFWPNMCNSSCNKTNEYSDVSAVTMLQYSHSSGHNSSDLLAEWHEISTALRPLILDLFGAWPVYWPTQHGFCEYWNEEVTTNTNQGLYLVALPLDVNL